MKRSRQAGFSYVEVLVATALIAVALVPMLDALRPGLQGAQIHSERAEIHFVLKGKMEEVLANRFHDLDLRKIHLAEAVFCGKSYMADVLGL